MSKNSSLNNKTYYSSNNKTYFWKSNYSIREKIDWLYLRITGHSKKNRNLFEKQKNMEKIPKKKYNKKITLLFTGDVMPINNNKISLSKEVKEFVKDVDLVVLNLEGIITKRRRWLALAHNKEILPKIKSLFKNKKIILNCANNHSGDFGKKELENSLSIIKKQGFKIIGPKNKKSISFSGINLVSGTFWSNQDHSFVNHYNDEAVEEINKLIKPNYLNIFLPHWSYEMHTYPRSEEIILAKKLLNKWDIIIGNHPHCPQPTEVLNQKGKLKLVSYSQGDFCCKSKRSIFTKGKLTKIIIDDNNKFVNYKEMYTVYSKKSKNIEVQVLKNRFH